MQTTETAHGSAITIRTGKPAFSCNSIRSGEPLSGLIHKIGHEIGNPLTAIISLATIMERFGPGSDAGERAGTYAASIIEEAWRISSLTERLVLLLSQRQLGGCSTNIEKSIKAAAARLTRLKDFAPVDLELHCPPSFPEAAVDGEQLKVLLQELLRNAFQAVIRASRSGKEEILDDLDCSTVVVALSEKTDEQQKNRLIIEVSNFSISPAPLPLTELFGPFVTGFPEQKLLGLGLTVAWAIAERFGGSLEIQEEPSGIGVRFTTRVTLPAYREARDPLPTKNAAANPFAAGFKPAPPLKNAELRPSSAPVPVLRDGLAVLIIDDEEHVASAIEKMLALCCARPKGLRCQRAKGQDAIALLEGGALFDVILCDLNLGDTSGRYVFEKIRGGWPEQAKRFAFLTGERGRQETENYLASSGRRALYKPFELHELSQLVRELSEEQS